VPSCSNTRWWMRFLVDEESKPKPPHPRSIS
jgi:hypothetical protein